MINQVLVKKLRTDKCWSQEHLALVAGLSLRTIQRIENEGKCSNDSKKALAAAFDCELDQLQAQTGDVVLPADDASLIAADSWLNSIDANDYATSWHQAGRLFQDRISIKQWQQSLVQVRRPLGEIISREVKNVSLHQSLPGVPDGQYTVITFTSRFDNKQSATETLSLIKNEDLWQVVGYFIC